MFNISAKSQFEMPSRKTYDYALEKLNEFIVDNFNLCIGKNPICLATFDHHNDTWTLLIDSSGVPIESYQESKQNHDYLCY